MAPKKPTPFDQPPRPYSSSDEEEEEEMDSEESEEETPQPQPQPKVSKRASAPPPAEVKSDNLKKPDQVVDASTDEESDTGSEMEATPPPADLAVKAHATKPVVVHSLKAVVKSKQKQTVGGVSAPETVKSGKKRQGESSKGDMKDAKKVKKVADVVEEKKSDGGVEEEVKKVVEDPKKQLFQRLFSEEDEIEVLKGMLEYSAKKGIDPMEDLNGFHDYVKGAIHVDVSSAQLVDKIRRLKKKYEKNAKKSKEGVDRTFGKSHEQISYDLSKKIWGFENEKTISANGGFELKANGKGKRTPKPNMTPDQKEKHALSLQIPKDLGVKNEKEHVPQSSSSSLSLSELTKSKDAAGMGLNMEFFKRGLALLGDKAEAGFDEKWKELMVAEGELYLKRVELVREQVKEIMDAYKASGH